MSNKKTGGQKGGQGNAEMSGKTDRSESAKRGAETVERRHPGFHAQIGSKGGSSRGKNR